MWASGQPPAATAPPCVLVSATMATKPPPLPPDARRPTGPHAATDEDAPDTDPDNPPPAPAVAARVRTPHAPPAPPPLPPPPPLPAAPRLNPNSAPARAGRALARAPQRRDRQASRSPTAPTAASSTGCCASTRSACCARSACCCWPAFGTYIYFAATLPTLPDIATYHEVAATTTVMRAADGTPLAELATERREILPFDKFPPQLVARLPGRRGSPLLRAPGHRLPRHRARADREPARRRGRPGRIDHHAAGGEVVPVHGADAAAQDPRGDPGAPAGAAASRSARS